MMDGEERLLEQMQQLNSSSDAVLKTLKAMLNQLEVMAGLLSQ